jgi:hypothetical protein
VGRIDGLYNWTSQACMILRLLIRFELDMNDKSTSPDPLQDAVISPNGISELFSSPPCKIPPPPTTPIYTHVDHVWRSSSQNKYHSNPHQISLQSIVLPNPLLFNSLNLIPINTTSHRPPSIIIHPLQGIVITP